MDTKEALKSFELDARLFYDAIAFSTDDYLYIIDMQRDIALVSDNMRDDFDLPDSLVPGLIPLWRELIVERDRKRFDDSIGSSPANRRAASCCWGSMTFLASTC